MYLCQSLQQNIYSLYLFHVFYHMELGTFVSTGQELVFHWQIGRNIYFGFLMAGDPHITVSELKEKLERGDNYICKKILYFSDTLRGTNQYWARRYKEVVALQQFNINNGDGLPSFFTTGSCAEFHFKPLKRLLAMYFKHTVGRDIDLSISSNMFNVLQENTHIVAKYFDLRTLSYFKNVMGPVFGVDCFWYRQEFAKSRGMVHWHGLCWRKDIEPHSLMHKCIEDGLNDAECAEALESWAKYEFGLSAEHPAGCDEAGKPRKDLWPPPEGTAPAPPEEKNPLVKLLMDVCDSQYSILEDYLLLSNRFNIHRCSDYCLRFNKHNKTEKECRMEFGSQSNPGKPLRSVPDLVKDRNGCFRLELLRDHPLLVQHSRLHTQGRRANGDISLILSKSSPENPSVSEIVALEKYTTGYSCKGNKASKAMFELFYEMIDSSSSHSTAKSFCTKYIKNTVKRDVSAVEASSELSRLPLYRCSCSFQSVSLSGFSVLEQDGSVVTKNTALDNYLNRDLDDICSYFTFISRNGKVAVFSCATQASWPLTEEYCQTQLLIHWPSWRKPSDINPQNTSWVEIMSDFFTDRRLSKFCKG
ncbi:hypothetical protein MAR_029746 [Mya arenaria]|uniref:Helitron helicase-like domain-containing protein n=1 Tax=Mya arenaria TaxID=6604 RepID=A0ABY7DKC5_MYAAR|nr:hypothetical protein MAR_029746 [Mya arenaria]